MFPGTVHHGEVGVGTGAGDSWPHRTHILEIERHECWSFVQFLIFCIQFRILGIWMVLRTVKVGFPSVVKPFRKCTHRCSKKCFHGDSKSNQVGSED